MGQFTFPATTQADFLVKLMASQNGDAATSATIVAATDQARDTRFCGESNNDGQSQLYTVYFDLVSITRSRVAGRHPARPVRPGLGLPDLRHHRQPGHRRQGRHLLRQRGQCRLDWQTENPLELRRGQVAAQSSWNKLLGRIQVSGGSYAQTQEFYSLLYKTSCSPTSQRRQRPVPGVGRQGAHPGQRAGDQYGIFSGGYLHSLASCRPCSTRRVSDRPSHWSTTTRRTHPAAVGYLNLDNYVMVGPSSRSSRTCTRSAPARST